MKQLFTLVLLLASWGLAAQETEQVILASNYQREGSTMIVPFFVPKSDVPVTLLYDVKDVFFRTEGQVYRAQSVTGELTRLSPGKHTLYWEIGTDAPNLYQVEELSIVIRFTYETQQQVQDWKQRQARDEQQRILEQIRQQERQRLQDSIRRAQKQVQYKEPERKEPKQKKEWSRPYDRSDLAMVGSLGSATFQIDEPVAEPKLLQTSALSWQAGLVFRTHLWSWFGVQIGGLYTLEKFAFTLPNIDETQYMGYSMVQMPLTGHLYLGKQLNAFAGHTTKFMLDSYTYDANGENREVESELLGIAKADLFDKRNGGWVYGLEWRGPNTALSFSYQMDKNPIKANMFIPRRHGAYWLSYIVFF